MTSVLACGPPKPEPGSSIRTVQTQSASELYKVAHPLRGRASAQTVLRGSVLPAITTRRPSVNGQSFAVQMLIILPAPFKGPRGVELLDNRSASTEPGKERLGQAGSFSQTTLPS